MVLLLRLPRLGFCLCIVCVGYVVGIVLGVVAVFCRCMCTLSGVRLGFLSVLSMYRYCKV